MDRDETYANALKVSEADYRRQVRQERFLSTAARRDNALKSAIAEMNAETDTDHQEWLEEIGPKTGKVMSEKLYSTIIDDKEIFGYKRAIASDGKVIFEEHGTSALHKVAADAVNAVVPYSVGITFLGGNNKVYNYHADDGEFAVGDLLMGDNGSYAEVVEVNTKSEVANKRFAGWKLNATKL